MALSRWENRWCRSSGAPALKGRVHPSLALEMHPSWVPVGEEASTGHVNGH